MATLMINSPFLFRSVLMIAVFVGLLTVDLPGDEPPAQDSTTTTEEQTHNEIRALRDAMIEAINKKDVATLTTLVHEDVVLITQDGDDLATIRKRAGVEDYMKRLLVGPDAGVQSITVNPTVDELTILHGDNTGIAFGTSSDHYVLRDGSEFALDTRWSTTLIKVDGHWQIASLQISTNLFENPVTQALSKFVIMTGIIAGVVGLLLGFFITRWSTRQSPPPAPATA